MSKVDLIREVLQEYFSPQHLEIIDESHLHAGHAGARDGGGHFKIVITSSSFSGQSTLARHRMIHEAASQFFGKTIHALSIKAKAPDEAQ